MHEPESPAKPGLSRVVLTALLLSALLLVLGNGLQGTLLSVRAGMEGMAQDDIGFMMSAYFAGFILGSLYIPRRVENVGHIRAFAAFASIASAIALIHVLAVSVWLWTLLRVLHGFCYAGLILVVESWLNGETQNSNRGRVLSVYQLVLMIGWVLSQLLLGTASPRDFSLFLVVSIFLSLSLVPVTLGRVENPGAVAATPLSLRRLLVISPLGVSGIFVAGTVFGSFVGMGPLFAHGIGLGADGIAQFMAITMLGAAVLQWPLGWLSDNRDRRRVIIWTSLGTALASLVLGFEASHSDTFLLPITFLYGALSFPLYSLCVAHVNDHIPQDSLVATASALVLVYGIGSALGPLVSGLLMSHLGSSGLFLFICAVQSLFALFGFYRLTRRGEVLPDIKKAYVPIPQTTHVASQLGQDP